MGPLGVVGFGVMILGVESVSGVAHGWAVEEEAVVGAFCLGVEGALVLAGVGVGGAWAAVLAGEGFPQPSRVLRVILRG